MHRQVYVAIRILIDFHIHQKFRIIYNNICPFETFTLKVDNCTGVPPLPKNVKYKLCLIIIFKTYFLLIAILKIIYLYIYFIYTVYVPTLVYVYKNPRIRSITRCFEQTQYCVIVCILILYVYIIHSVYF